MFHRVAFGATLLAASLTTVATAAPIELAADEIRVNLGARTLQDSHQLREILATEFDARFVHQLDRIHATTVVIPEAALARLRRNENVRALANYIQRDRRAFIPEQLDPEWIDTYDGPGFDDTVPNDTYYGNQWGMPCIDLETTWQNKGFAERNVTIAIIDTGTDLDHSDLAAHVNTVDDYDFVNNDNNADDDNGHGTHTAGIAAAMTNNNRGVAGVLNMEILPIKVLDSGGSGWWSDVAAGINHAVTKNADVISMSLGGGSDNGVRNACLNAYNAGLLVFGSAGNHGGYSNNYPGAYTSVIGVGSLSSCSNLSSFSGRGLGDETQEGNVELVGAGSNIYSTYRGNGYTYMSGTSMSCPQAAGVGAGYMAFAPGTMSNVKMRKHMQRKADDLGSSGPDDLYGYGRVDAWPFSD